MSSADKVDMRVYFRQFYADVLYERDLAALFVMITQCQHGPVVGTQVWWTDTGVVVRVVVQLCSRRRCRGCEPSTSQGPDLVLDVPSVHRCDGLIQVWWSECLFNSAVGVGVEVVNHQHLRVQTRHSMFPVYSRYTRVLTTHTHTFTLVNVNRGYI